MDTRQVFGTDYRRKKVEIDTNACGVIVLRKIFTAIRLATESNEQMIMCMRDSGFEFEYGGVWYEAKEGKVSPLSAKNTEQANQPDSGE
jgi:hypothetical protein